MSDSRNTSADAAADAALRVGLRAASLSPGALQRIRRATETEWRAGIGATGSRPGLGRKWKLAAAASLLVLVGASVVGVLGLDGAPSAGALVATVERSDAPGIHRLQFLRADEPVSAGSELRVSANLQARGDALLKLAGGGNLRVARGSRFDIADAHTVRLTRGELYVDIPPGSRAGQSFVVLTPAGRFSHVGTQFSLAIIDDGTRLRVREGAVLWRAASGDQAGGDQKIEAGTELIASKRAVSRRPIATSGRDWAWTESLAPEIEIDDRPLREFLDWFSRETGRRLELADGAARAQVDTIRMHGNLRGLTVMEALTAVMAATTLHYELPEGAIRVSSPGESQPTR